MEHISEEILLVKLNNLSSRYPHGFTDRIVLDILFDGDIRYMAKVKGSLHSLSSKGELIRDTSQYHDIIKYKIPIDDNMQSIIAPMPILASVANTAIDANKSLKRIERYEVYESVQLLQDDNKSEATAINIWETFFKDRCCLETVRRELKCMVIDKILKRHAIKSISGGKQYLYSTVDDFPGKLAHNTIGEGNNHNKDAKMPSLNIQAPKSPISEKDILHTVGILSLKYKEGVSVKDISKKYYNNSYEDDISNTLNALYMKGELIRGKTVVDTSGEYYLYKLAADKPVLHLVSDDRKSRGNENPHPKPLTVENVLRTLESICQQCQKGVTANLLQEKYFPKHRFEMVKDLLEYLESIGKAAYEIDRKNNNAKIYHPTWGWPPKDKKKVIEAAPKPHNNEKALAVKCLHCEALIGVRSQDGLYTVECTGCGKIYLYNNGWLYSLEQGLIVEIWSPANGNKKKALAINCVSCDELLGVKAQDGLFIKDCTSCGTAYLYNKGCLYRLGDGIQVQEWSPVIIAK